MEQDMLGKMFGYVWVIPLLAMLFGYKLVLRLFGVIIIPDDSVGIVNKKFVLFGANRSLPDGRIIALNGEAGIQADTLAPGIHYLYWPWQYDIEVAKFVTVPEGKLGVVESRDGGMLGAGRLLAKSVACDNFQNARAFLTDGGQRGPQMSIIPPGTYRVNTSLFSVDLKPAFEVADNMVAIITTKDGKSLRAGEIAGDVVEDHCSFQDGEAFITNGGQRGLQEQVLTAGRYYLNPLFVSTETVPMTMVPIAHAGVMVAFVGKEGADVTGVDFKHGNQVAKGCKGVWNEPLDPGKYPINPYTHKLVSVPTSNIVLNWATGKTESHKLDENLSTIALHTKDGFTLKLDVSQIIHIGRNDAPRVIAQFGSVETMVTQVLEPLISNHFRNAGQTGDALSFLQERAQRQTTAKQEIKKALDTYNVNAVDTLIGDIHLPPELMKTLTDKKLAEQQKMTFETQQKAAEAEKELEQAKAMAATQAKVVDAERKEKIAEYEGKAAVAKAKADADSAIEVARGAASAKKAQADADAHVLKTVGEAQAMQIEKVGTAEADVIKKKTLAVGQNQYAIMEVAKALSNSKQELVPKITVNGDGKDGNGGGLTSILMAQLVSGNMFGAGGGMAQASSATGADEAAASTTSAPATAVDTAVTAASATSNGNGHVTNGGRKATMTGMPAVVPEPAGKLPAATTDSDSAAG